MSNATIADRSGLGTLGYIVELACIGAPRGDAEREAEEEKQAV